MEKAVRTYLDCLVRADLSVLLGLFAPEAIVVSPLYGEMSAKHFYPDLFADTRTSVITLHTIFTNPVASKAVVHFHYGWTLADGSKVGFSCVDIFQFNANGQITRLEIIYDTAATRPAFDRQRSST